MTAPHAAVTPWCGPHVQPPRVRVHVPVTAPHAAVTPWCGPHVQPPRVRDRHTRVGDAFRAVLHLSRGHFDRTKSPHAQNPALAEKASLVPMLLPGCRQFGEIRFRALLPVGEFAAIKFARLRAVRNAVRIKNHTVNQVRRARCLRPCECQNTFVAFRERGCLSYACATAACTLSLVTPPWCLVYTNAVERPESFFSQGGGRVGAWCMSRVLTTCTYLHRRRGVFLVPSICGTTWPGAACACARTSRTRHRHGILRALRTQSSVNKQSF